MRSRTDGEAIRRLRENKGLTNLALATLADISPTYMCRLEREERQGSLAIRVRIAQALGVQVSDISKPVTFVAPIPARQQAA